MSDNIKLLVSQAGNVSFTEHLAVEGRSQTLCGLDCVPWQGIPGSRRCRKCGRKADRIRAAAEADRAQRRGAAHARARLSPGARQ